MAKIDEESQRGAKAEAVLRNDIFIETFEVLEQAYIDAWKNTDQDQTEERERIFRLQHTLNEVKSHIENVALTGRMAVETIETAIR